ncbi:hypothetical protein Pint_28803 [Pistacia integerrima]|uniref:Uncharacterized protein n=1 Tax=Pistacia integerrima TaxID=434235 RepID=A0ACC0X1U9_9ROSI|nr:hypothetical protein Pint_28803 [Pistacia integerrima]
MVWGDVASETLQLNDHNSHYFSYCAAIGGSRLLLEIPLQQLPESGETAACSHTKESFGRVTDAFCTEVVLMIFQYEAQSNDKNQEKSAFSYMKRTLISFAPAMRQHQIAALDVLAIILHPKAQKLIQILVQSC